MKYLLTVQVASNTRMSFTSFGDCPEAAIKRYCYRFGVPREDVVAIEEVEDESKG